MDFANSYAAIVKQEKQEDGTLLVYGKATDDSLDIDQQICDDTWLSSAMPEWFKSGGNIREQHSSIAAGVAKEYESKADGHYISVLVVDPVSVKKVESGVLKGFSIGIKSPRVVRDQKAANGRIIDGQIVEVSLVDRPANPNAKLMLAKSVEGETSLVKVEEYSEKETEMTQSKFTMEDEIKPEDESIAKSEDGSAGCDCDEDACKGCDKTSAKSADLSKCLECGCHAVTDSHGLTQIPTPGKTDGTVSNVTTAVIVTPEQGAGSIKSVEAEDITEEPAIVEEAKDDVLSEKFITSIIEKATQSAAETVRAEIDSYKAALKVAENKSVALESELTLAKSAAVSGGPKRTGRVVVNDSNELLIKAAEYRLKAAATSDQILAKGYKALEKEYLSKASGTGIDE